MTAIRPLVLITAVPFESEWLRQQLQLTPSDWLNPFEAFSGPEDVLLLHSGVGKANAASAVTALLERVEPRAVILSGCGGAYPQSGLGIGDLAVATSENFGDEGVRAPGGFQDMAAIDFPLLESATATCFNTFPVSAALTEKLLPAIEATASVAGVSALSGPFVTVSTCSGTTALGRELEQRTEGICESMEGAAVASVCCRYQVPLLEIRGISNLTVDRDLASWRLRDAAAISQQAVIDLLPQL